MAKEHFLLLLLDLIALSKSQTCLASPNELQWILGADGAYHGELTFGPTTLTINGVTFTTRAHDNDIPSPTIRFIPGEIYNLTLINTLGPEPQGIKNQFRDWNWTNIHTHGLHISGETPADDVFTVAEPGDTIEYIYEIPCDHSGGTLWYHPHHHGSTATHVAGGAVGAIIVEPNEVESSTFPAWYKNMPEIVLIVQNLELTRVADIGGDKDKLFQSTALVDMYLVNGEYQPTVCMETGVWKKLRMVHADVDSGITLKVNGPSCSVFLLAKDGILIHGINNEVPREIRSKEIYFTLASRVDVAIQCDMAGSYTVTSGGTTIFTLEVTGDVSVIAQLTPWHPLRPRYLQSLLFEDVDGTESINFAGRRVNGQTFQNKDTYLFTIQQGTVQDFSISGTAAHPYHVHINHFQILDCSTGPEGWSEVGDWIDTADFQGTVRFGANTYGGRVVVHCHKLEHEDEGLMGIFRIQGGCDALQGDIDTIGPPCVFDGCEMMNSSFSDYNWANESIDYVPAACPVDAESNTALAVGLGVGIPLGCCLIIGVVVLFICYRRKKQVEHVSGNTHTAIATDDKDEDDKDDDDL